MVNLSYQNHRLYIYQLKIKQKNTSSINRSAENSAQSYFDKVRLKLHKLKKGTVSSSLLNVKLIKVHLTHLNELPTPLSPTWPSFLADPHQSL